MYSQTNPGRGSISIPKEGLISFYYDFGTSSEWTTYDIYLDKGTVRLVASIFCGGEKEMDIDAEATEEVLHQLNMLVHHTDLAKWNGINTNWDDLESDDYTYWMEIVYAEGTTISTYGEGIPDGFEDVNAAVTKFFAQVTRKYYKERMI